MVSSPPKKYDAPRLEEEIIETWQKEGTFEASIENRAQAEPFVFLEGPPTANGLPHPGHVLTRTLKDTVCRYKTQRGYRVERKAGWDCHGLPVEIEVQKELGISDIQEIEKYGVEAFNKKCAESVFRYKGEWERMSRRVGFWLDFDDPYVTMDTDYIESVWWSLKELYENDLMFKAHKVVPYCPQTGTSYSSHEVAQGYKTVDDLSVTVKFPLKDDPDGASLLSWTTTPWTLPGNIALAVGEDIQYVRVRVKGKKTGKKGKKKGAPAHAEEGEVLILAKALQQQVLGHDVEVLSTFDGVELVAKAYQPLFPGAVDTSGHPRSHTIVPADFVTTEEGTGIVHTAVMYGEDDYRLGEEVGLPKQHTVDLEGRFVDSVGAPLAGRYVKECDDEIAQMLKERGLLYKAEVYEHSYPHCWRTGHPLLYYAMDSWYIRMSRKRDELLAANGQVAWHPETIKEGRFGEWLRNVKDWAISRSRYWGTPLPVWTCHGQGDDAEAGCGHQTAVGSREQLKDLIGTLPQDLHRPYIDVDAECSGCGGTMRREPYVIDTWYDSGAAHFAQWHHPLGDVDRKDHFPIDFIAEGLDQTRGWFYTLLATGVAVFDQRTYNNVLVNGLVLAEDGQKMSKSKRNYTDPWGLFNELGADAVRWRFLTASAPWADTRFYPEAVRGAWSKYLLTLFNTYSFFATYAHLDGWDKAHIDKAPPVKDRPLIDRWILSRLSTIRDTVTTQMDDYHLHKATRALEQFVVEDVSNWYVRRVRKRLWREEDDADKRAAFATLGEVLEATAALTAPFTPFIAEIVHRGLRTDDDPASVHLGDWPTPDHHDEALETAMEAARSLVEQGRALRSKKKINVRTPVAGVHLVPTKDATATTEHLEPLLGLVAEELNAKHVSIKRDEQSFQRLVATAEPSRVGPRFKQHAKEASAAIEALDPQALQTLQEGGTVPIQIAGEEHTLTQEDARITSEDAEGYAVTKAAGYLLAVETTLTPELEAEGLSRELVRRIQEMRKSAGLHLEDRIAVRVRFEAPPGVPVEDHKDHIASEVRASDLGFEGELERPNATKAWQIDDHTVHIDLVRTETKQEVSS